MHKSRRLIHPGRILPIVSLMLMLAACSPSDGSSAGEWESPSVRVTEKIKLQPLSKVDPKHCAIVKDALESYYNCEVVLQESVELPQEAWYAPRKRYRADSLLRFLLRNMEPKYDRVIGLTEMDISTTKPPHEDWGIMGLGSMPGSACVVSTFRIKKGVSPEQFSIRLARVAKHELGHTMGLRHCENKACFMRDANGKAATVDKEGDELCGRCKVVVGKRLARQGG